MPGGPGNILIGRGQDFAWSADVGRLGHQRPVRRDALRRLDTKYLYKGKCRAMGRVDAGTIAGQGEVVYRTTVHGPVHRLRDRRRQAGRDLLQALQPRQGHPLAGHVQAPVATARSRGLESFYDAPRRPRRSRSTSRYADDKHIATYSAGRLPLRDQRVDPRLPTNGTGKYEWKGFLPPQRPPARGRPGDGRARQLEQQAGARLRRRPTPSGATARSSACRCSTPASPPRRRTTSPR